MPFMGLGTTELLIILLIAIILLGPSKIPQLAKSLGEAIREFRKASSGTLEEEEKAKLKNIKPENIGEEEKKLLKKLAKKLDVDTTGKSDEELLKAVLEKAEEKGLLGGEKEKTGKEKEQSTIANKSV